MGKVNIHDNSTGGALGLIDDTWLWRKPDASPEEWAAVHRMLAERTEEERGEVLRMLGSAEER